MSAGATTSSCGRLRPGGLEDPLQVGRVAGYELSESGDSVDVQIFVESPHDSRIRSTTRFWNASGLDAERVPD